MTDKADPNWRAKAMAERKKYLEIEDAIQEETKNMTNEEAYPLVVEFMKKNPDTKMSFCGGKPGFSVDDLLKKNALSLWQSILVLARGGADDGEVSEENTGL